MLAMQGGFGWCQMYRRPALRSGSGSVLLIARVESLSVGAALDSAIPVGLQGRTAAVSQEVAVTTRWAVPANYTTFRLMGYVGEAGPFGAGARVESSETSGDETGSAEPGETLLVVDSGSNAAKTRTDEIALGYQKEGQGERRTAAEGGRLTILVQAL